ncbi:uncharacterized protein LOC123880058 [Maniola jurtina]|uniref:uncharacterized protein LOC123880058 n=1 Tax=Maniola jurtina TaxID=191418 RepID=UPI001E68EB44|nr:uncharacterized protein LOC123880058 [Maniola jurtina]
MFHRTVLRCAVLIVLVPLVVGGPWQRPQRTRRSPSTLDTITIISLEEPCALQGGMCMRSEDCEPGNWVRIQADLCPEQKHMGIGCCYN